MNPQVLNGLVVLCASAGLGVLIAVVGLVVGPPLRDWWDQRRADAHRRRVLRRLARTLTGHRRPW